MLLIVETFLLVLCAAVAAVGYGSGLSLILPIESNLGDRGILGLLSFGLLGCVLHFMIPLTPSVQFVVLAGGIFVAVISKTGRRVPKLAWAAAAIIFVFLLSHRQSNLAYDTGLYHLQTMRWLTEHRIVPGLGNLHGRLAFNSMIFLIAAVADRSGIGWISNLLVLLFVLLSLFLRLRDVTTDDRLRSGLVFSLLVFSIWMLSQGYIHGWYGVLNADVFTAVLIIYWTSVATGLSASPDLATDVAMAVFSVLLAVTVKVSAAPLILPTVALAWIYRRRLPAAFSWRVAACASLVLAFWMVRGITLSGCAVYPVPQTCIQSLSWATSESQVSSESISIRSWARQPGEVDFAKVLKGQAWLPKWFSGARHDRSLIMLSIFVPLGLITALLRTNFNGTQAHSLLVMTGGLVGCLIFWFVTAPDPRFGVGFILAVALLGASIAFAEFFDQPRLAVFVPALVLASMVLVSIPFGLRRVTSDYFYKVPDASAYQLREANGNRIFVPKVTDQCWDHQVPCTPYFNPAALAKIVWPAHWPVPPPGWIPDNPLGVVKTGPP